MVVLCVFAFYILHMHMPASRLCLTTQNNTSLWNHGVQNSKMISASCPLVSCCVHKYLSSPMRPTSSVSQRTRPCCRCEPGHHPLTGHGASQGRSGGAHIDSWEGCGTHRWATGPHQLGRLGRPCAVHRVHKRHGPLIWRAVVCTTRERSAAHRVGRAHAPHARLGSKRGLLLCSSAPQARSPAFGGAAAADVPTAAPLEPRSF